MLTMKLCAQVLTFTVCVVTISSQQSPDGRFDFNLYSTLKFYVTHRGGLIVPGKIIRGGDASCVMTSFQENREEGNFTYVVEFTERGRPACLNHTAYPLEDGFAFVALSGDTVNVRVADTDYSNYAILMYSYADRNYPIVMATNRMANSVIRQRFMEMTGGTLASLEVIDNGSCQQT